MAKTVAEIDYSRRLKNWQWEQFCQTYLITNNGAEAARVAKYSLKGVNGTGSRLLANVSIAGRIAYLKGQLAKKSDIDAQRVINEYSKIAFANIQQFLDSKNQVRDISELPADVAAAVESIQIDIRHDTVGPGHTEKVKFKLCSKLGALNDLARHLGLFEKDNDQSRTQVAIQIVNYSGASQ
jgi:phage terminase small subunit